MNVCRTIITKYLHINLNYHTKTLARKSLVFVYQPIKCYNKFMLHNLSSSLSHYSLILSFSYYSYFHFQLLSFSFLCFYLCVICWIFLYVFLHVSFVSFMFFFVCLYSYYLCSFIVHFWGFYAFCSTLVAQLQKTFSIS
jgi:hypothetical protein